MSFQINTNTLAMGALRNLNATGSEISKSVQRLSTGLRINSGDDDPSGLIASETYRSQISGLDQANRNVQNATNFAKTAEGGLSEIQKLLSSARTLAVSNGDASLDNSQKQANQSQLDSIVSSISRIANQTQFGSKNLLNGANGATASVIQSGNITAANFQGVLNGSAVTSSGNISVTMTTAATQATVQSSATYTAGTVTVGAGTFSVNGKSFNTSAATTASDVVSMVNSAAGETGVTVQLNSTNNKLEFKSVNYGSDQAVTVSDSFGLLQGSSTASASRATGVDAVATVTVGSTSATFNKGKGLQLKDADGNTMQLTAAGNATTAASNMAYLSVNSSSSFQIGANAGQTADLTLGSFTSSSLGISSLDIVGSSSSALTAIDSAISSVSTALGRIGSFVKNTLEAQGRSLGVAKENLMAADSTIRDLDVAAEMTNYSKLQILQQSGLSVLAQANSSSQGVLSLLRG